MQNIHVTDFLSEAWGIFKRNPWLAIGGFVLYTLISLAGGYIPILNIFFGILVFPALIGGYVLFFLKFARDDNPEINNLFEGFNRYGTLMGIYWLMAAAFLVCMLPTIILTLILFAAGGGSFLIPVIGIANVIAVIYLLIRYSMVYFVIMDDRFIGVFDALKESERITKGYYWDIFLYWMLAIVITIVSIILFFLPYLAASPILAIGMARLYLRLKEIAGSDDVGDGVVPPAMPPPPEAAAEDDNEPPTMPPPEDLPPPDEDETR